MMSAFSSGNNLKFTLDVLNYPEAAFSVLDFNLDEGYSRLYELELHLIRSSFDTVDPARILDQSVMLKIWRNDVLQDAVSGMVTEIEQGDTGFRHTHYRLIVRPDLWRLTLGRTSRIFQAQDVKSIISTILKAHQVTDFDFWLHPDRHRVREFCVQYRESDFDFLCRLAAEEGIVFYFERREYRQFITFFDHTYKILERKPVIYNPNKNAQLQQQVVTTFRCGHKIRPSRVIMRDYTFKNPDWKAEYYRNADDDTYQREGYTHFDYPGRFKNEEGEHFTRYRLESLRNDAHSGQGESNIAGLHPGTLFSLTGHPTEEWNSDWQITGIRCTGRQPQAAEEESGEGATTFSNRFEFIPVYQPWRAPIAYKPRVDGPQTGVVTGPAGEEIYTDRYGRVRVQFHWDREGTRDERSSCWIRVASGWAGQGWGMLALPRVGQEVIVSFQEGDPDQPLITGRVYNANQLPPGHLPHSKTQMYLQSKTYKGNGYNRLMFDDATNDELFSMRAEKDMETLVRHDQRNRVKNNRTLDVEGTQTTTVGKGRSTTVYSGNDVKNVLAGNLIESVSLLRSTQAQEIFKYAAKRIELEVGEQTSVTLDNGKILLRFGKNTILMNAEGIWLDGKHIGVQETEVELSKNTGEHRPVEQYSLRFKVFNDGIKDYKNMPYSLILSNGEVLEGITDDEGYTQTHYTDEEVTAKVNLNF